MDSINISIDTALSTYSDMVYKLALSLIKNKEGAEDIFQDVFLKLMTSNVAFTGDEHIKAWLIRTTINRCKTFWRSAWFRHTAPLEDTIAKEQDFKIDDVFLQVMALPTTYKTVIHLFYYEDLSIAQIAKITETKKETVASQLSRGRALLRKKLKGAYQYE